MRIPLIVNASPSRINFSTKIRLRGGLWFLVHDLQDTEIDVHVEDCSIQPNNFIDVAPWQTGILWISIKKAGTEPRINIFAVKD